MATGGGAEWPGYERLMKRLARYGHIEYEDAIPLLEDWREILTEDNRKGILSQQDKDGNRMKDTTYRGSSSRRTAARKGNRFGTTTGTPKPSGPLASGLHGNLTTAEYKKLTGPPLAPRDEESRVIANYQTAHGQDGTTFFAVGRWEDVVSVKGVSFLPAHFKGLGHLPRRDLRGVRPWGKAQALKSLRAWVRLLVQRK